MTLPGREKRIRANRIQLEGDSVETWQYVLDNCPIRSVCRGYLRVATYSVHFGPVDGSDAVSRRVLSKGRMWHNVDY